MKLNPFPIENLRTIPQFIDAPGCFIKKDVAEIIFSNGIDERIIQNVMKELKRPFNNSTQQIRPLIGKGK